jgi:hypothetical protein
MALLTVEGIYKDGKVEHPELPGTIDSPSQVIVTFLPALKLAVGSDPGVVENRETIRLRVIARMRDGIHFGGPPYPSREELHDR